VIPVSPLIAAALLPASSPSGASKTVVPAETFSCHFYRNVGETKGESEREDLKITQSGPLHGPAGAWTVQLPGQAVIKAEAFEAKFGSIGGSMGLRWTAADGRPATAYISFSDVTSANGKIYFWLSLDRPSLWQPPGYGCESRRTERPGAKS
jgi:hypothetical protein